MTTTLLLALVLSLPAAALPAAPVLPHVALPGYGPAGDDAPAVARRPASEFPSESELLGEGEDRSAALVGPEDDLRDAVAQPPAGWLQAGLRSPSISTRLSAVRAAARSRYDQAVPYLSGLLLQLDEPVLLRAAAAVTLGRIGDKVAVPVLAQALGDPTPEVRYAAALSLGRLPAGGVAARLARVLNTDPASPTRCAAAVALGRTGKLAAATALAKALTSDASWQVRRQAALSLQEMGAVRQTPALVTALHDGDFSVRAAAGSALARFDGPTTRRALRDALREETEPSVRVVLSAALRRARRPSRPVEPLPLPEPAPARR